MWAIFERTVGRQSRSDRVKPIGTHRPVTPELPELVEAMRLHGLDWA